MSHRTVLERNFQREKSKLNVLYNSCSEIIKVAPLDIVLSK